MSVGCAVESGEWAGPDLKMLYHSLVRNSALRSWCGSVGKSAFAE